MTTQTQALDTLFHHGKAIHLQAVYFFYIYVITSVSRSDENEGETVEPNIFCSCPLLIKGKEKEKKRADKCQLGVDFCFL